MRESNPREARSGTLHEAIRPIEQCNPEAFERVYKANSELVRRICLRMLRDPIEAEDAAQDVFVCVLLKLHTFRGESALSSWLYRLTTNLILMRFRKNNHKQVPLRDFLAGNGELFGDIAKPDLYLNGVVDRVDLQAALDQLPDGYRAVFVLHDIQGFAHEEIAKRFGYSVGNSKSQLHKARKRLRELLAERPIKGPQPAATQTRLLAVNSTPGATNHPIGGSLAAMKSPPRSDSDTIPPTAAANFSSFEHSVRCNTKSPYH